MTTVDQLRLLIGNPRALATQGADGSWTPHRKPITDEHLKYHLEGRHTLGTYVLDGDQARTLVFDIDSGEKEDAKAIQKTLTSLGIPSGVEFSGRKGYHVWVVVERLVPTRPLRRLGRAVLGLAGVQAEIFPKQDATRDLGNLVKLPGGVHRVTGKRNEFLTPFPDLVPTDTLRRITSKLPEEPQVRRPSYEGTEIRPCVAAACEGISEGSRNAALMQLAIHTLKAGLSVSAVVSVVRRAANRCDPPYIDEMPESIVERATNYGFICSQIEGEDYHCGDQCILRKRRGLETRSGDLRHSIEGETIVVKVEKKDGAAVRVTHDDANGGSVLYLTKREEEN